MKIQANICRLLLLLLISFSSFVGAETVNRPAPWVGDTFAGGPCRGKGQGFGPFDYLERFKHKNELKLVEGAHFKPRVENMQAGVRQDKPFGDLDYTLRAWPNHHRALYSAVKYQALRTRLKQRNQLLSPAECYLQRAINYSPMDNTPHMLYGMLLHKAGKNQKALEQYRMAEKIKPSDYQTKYNMGLLLVDLKKYDQANRIAQELYANGFPLPGLKNKLKAKGKWKALPPTAPEKKPEQEKADTTPNN